ncbi:hypothetical protein A2303_01800 [Candidatus Falkowbacteria bacterium RIFOXYB2_FULL_47_14]|uniref:Response regulatory domain-containing protein n=1 Tax=Candidatus Falkowbacteria bacterium RIFOXYA2_FULL_47_19 TaxID=1797994 RepID=A0A1F5SJE3_9BACT|nr:MAG: hypothetical protein A2227_06135 [Candidatus Falkowbacteria bacterium RIFOXYA2_FULL_47_19]OGF37093.1 MAG: hypothetical protein A2468_05325 [Candidatus Falkowbacteria bacterium RIFOXYC2_FULL_46_15]OGF43247.1 MAG: hypothetical protein A2303_01800 [Candidatus Falkowbacteria bacterium RIFOXYB2_FULL_47_14]
MPNKKYRVLLAEDDKFISMALSESLSRAGFEVVAAYDGEEALSKIKIVKPDIILLDLIMPKKDGFDVLEELNREETREAMNGQNNESIPIIVFTNLDQDQDMKKAIDLGAREYLIKANISMEEVIKKIRKYLGIADEGEMKK